MCSVCAFCVEGYMCRSVLLRVYLPSYLVGDEELSLWETLDLEP